MVNEILLLVTVIISFTGILLFYKAFGKLGIFCWVTLATVAANIEVTKSIDMFGLAVTLGNALYGANFLATDILSEFYGGKEARKAVKIGFFSLISFTILMQFSLLFVPNSADIANDALNTIFSLLPRVCAASLIAFAVSNTFDTYLYEWIRKRCPSDKFLWVRNNGSTMVSQILDSLIFFFVAFIGVYPVSMILEFAATTYVIKLIVAALDTPFLYLARRIHRERVLKYGE